MKKLLLIACLFTMVMVTHLKTFGQCFTAPYGQYPAATFTPTCNNTFVNIATDCYTGEYSLVNVISGNTYTFRSTRNSNGALDYITISNAAGTLAYVFGTSTVTWVATFTGVVRFYSHNGAGCASNTNFRTRSVRCNGPACALNTVTVNMFDTFGDGWNNATFTLYNSSAVPVGTGTLATGTTGSATFCLPTGCYTISIFNGDYPNEISWNVTVNGGPPVSAGGAFVTNFVVPVNTSCPGSITCNTLVPFSGNNTITACSGSICDHAGMYNYSINANGYTVINPSGSGNFVQLTGYLNAESGYDYVEFYDGVGLGGTLIGAYWGSGPIPTINSITGSITVHYVSDVSNNLSGFVFDITCTNPLPIELISFDATCDMQSGNRTISWQTASETNNEHFVIERSSNAIDWTEVHRESGAGNSNTQLSYEWIDQEIVSSTVYYRLTQVDFNGQSETFNPTTVTCNPDVPVAQIRPNPNDGNFQLWFTEPQEGTEALIEIVDNMGRVLSQQTVTGTGTAIAVQFNVTLNAGVYHLRIGGSAPQTVNFIVIK